MNVNRTNRSICGLLLGVSLFAERDLVAGDDSGTKESDAPERVKLSEDQRARFFEYMIQAQKGEFVISGDIADRAGKRLDGVTMDISWFIPDLHEGKTKKDSRSINGDFTVDVRQAMSLELRFTKDGYYSAKTNFAVPEMSREMEEHILESVRAGKKPRIEQQTCTHHNVRIVLEKKGKIACLARFAGVLKYEMGGKGVVIDFDKPPVPDRQDEHLRPVENLQVTNRLPTNCAYICPELCGDGTIAVVEVPSGDNAGEYKVPKSVRLCIMGGAGGLVLSDYGDGQETNRKLRRAPEKGYVSELVLDASRIGHMIDGTQNDVFQFFFFKVGDKFGKGNIYPHVVKRNSVVSLGVEFLLQPDGSRNLETGE